MRWFHSQETQPWNQINQHLDFWVLTMKPDGTDVCVAVGPEQWKKGGHHINWFPDGEHLSMNLAIHGDKQIKLVRVRYDGTNLGTISDRIPGSGHPTVHPNGRHILTDTYAGEPTAFGDGTIPLRWIDLQTQTEQTLVRVNVAHPASKLNGSLRVDAHPAWAPDYRHIVFNGYVNGARRVFIADLGEVL
jgi:Tol biopolymer transport system component